MIVAGIIAEFNPFHSGHKYLIDKCKKELGVDRVVVVMSGDFVQRGAPAIMDKFARTRIALKAGADVVLELPVYYSTGSAEFFAEGAVAILDKLGCVDYLCFGSETPDLEKMNDIADILCDEPPKYRAALNDLQKKGLSFAAAREEALMQTLLAETGDTGDTSFGDAADVRYKEIISSPNNILALEYLKALKKRKSSIKPFTVMREGAPYNSLEGQTFMSASGVRARMLSSDPLYVKEKAPELFEGFVPECAIEEICNYKGFFLDSNDFSEIMHYKLLSEKNQGYTDYLDVSHDLSNRIQKNLESFDSLTFFCQHLKTKNLAYSRISRSLFHILFGITEKNMTAYKADVFTSYARILGMRREAAPLLAVIHEAATIPVIERLKTAEKSLSSLQLQLLNETLSASEIYNMISHNEITSEYRLKPIIL